MELGGRWSRLVIIGLILALTLTGCSKLQASFKSVVQLIGVATFVVVIVNLAFLIVKKILFVGLFDEPWQLSVVVKQFIGSVISGLIAIYLALDAGRVVDSIVLFVRRIQ